MKLELTPQERKQLKARAHGLVPLVSIGKEGLSASVLREIDRSLTAHELIKIRGFTDERAEREGWFDAICDALHAAPVQHIGKILVIYRENPDKKAAVPTKPKRRGPRLTKRQEVNKAIAASPQSRRRARTTQ